MKLTLKEREVVKVSLILALSLNALSYNEEDAVRGILNREFPDAIIKRGIPTKYARDLRGFKRI
jgi:hypothetical protein